MNTEIGGFFELELRHGDHFHAQAVKLNSGRNALKFMLNQSRFSKVYLPDYICRSVRNVLFECGIPFESYSLDPNLAPATHRQTLEHEAYLYVNYFGIHDHVVESLRELHANLIVDNSQAFFSRPRQGVKAFYSPRKFFGVPDGGYAYCDPPEIPLEKDVSYSRIEHLVRRIDVGGSGAYETFRENEKLFDSLPVRGMSELTQRLLMSIDYDHIAQARRRNFLVLHSKLGQLNRMPLRLDRESVPMIYPFVSVHPGLREYLVEHRVYVARYWHEVQDWTPTGSTSHFMMHHLLPLPIDQRYAEAEMARISALIMTYVNRSAD